MHDYKLYEITITSAVRKLTTHNCLCITSGNLDHLKPRAADFLHAEEYKFFQTLDFPRRQSTYLSGHYAAKLAVQHLNSNLKLSEIQVCHGIFWFPYLVTPHWVDHQISVSHSDTVGAAIAFQQACPMAVDIEMLNPDRTEIMQSEMTANDIKLVREGADNYQHGMSVAWTAKESLSKALRCGLHINFKYLELAEFKGEDGHYACSFKNFPQYQTRSMLIGDHIYTILYPNNTSFIIVEA